MKGRNTVGFSEIVVEGNIGKEPELKFTPGGDSVCNMSVAVSARRKVDGEWVDGEVTWYRVAAWGKFGEACMENVSKGDAVIVRGKFKLSTYQKDGETKTMPEITAETLGVIPKQAPKTMKGEDGPSW